MVKGIDGQREDGAGHNEGAGALSVEDGRG